jgi:hypothetical protein
MNGQTKKSPLEQFALNVSLTISSVYTGYTLEDLKDDLRFIGEGIWAQLRLAGFFFGNTL